jgi:uncharacterized protein
MSENILKYLSQIAEEKEVEILFACESGSRAWGFPSPDSDYDVRFVYHHKRDWYLSLTEQKDTIEKMLDEKTMDLSGWDLKKSLVLLSKSNPALFELIQSPIIYYANEPFLSGINEISKSHYSKVATMHHYLSMSKKMFYEVKEKEQVKLKKLFYALRTSMACKWIMEREDFPPIVFQSMMEGLKIDSDIKQKIYTLIDLKATKDENYLHHQELDLNFLIENWINEAEVAAKTLPAAKGKMNELNSFFIQNIV